VKKDARTEHGPVIIEDLAGVPAALYELAERLSWNGKPISASRVESCARESAVLLASARFVPLFSSLPQLGPLNPARRNR